MRHALIEVADVTLWKPSESGVTHEIVSDPEVLVEFAIQTLRDRVPGFLVTSHFARVDPADPARVVAHCEMSTGVLLQPEWSLVTCGRCKALDPDDYSTPTGL